MSSFRFPDGRDSANLQADCPLFRLPREVRDFIYDNYTTIFNGYRYNASLTTLVQADGGHIDLRLAHTCRRVRNELKNVAMQNNKIVFRTCCTPEGSIRAGALHANLHRAEQAKWFKVCMAGPAFLTDDMKRKVQERFPYYRPVLDGLSKLAGEDINGQSVSCEYMSQSWGQPPSVFRDFLDYLFDLLAKNPDWTHLADTAVSKAGNIDKALADPVLKPWSVLSDQDVDRLKTMLYPNLDWNKAAFARPSDNYAISAAATAITFLESLSPVGRKALREIELVEDEASVGFSESHARGLIQYCQENPKLRIKRIASLWKILPPAFPNSHVPNSWYIQRGFMVEEIAKWAVEAAALPSLGMPEQAFTLILDSETLDAEASDIFQAVLEDCSIQAAMDVRFKTDLLADDRWLSRADANGWILHYYEGFPEIIRDVQANNTGLVRCNFNIGSIIDVESVLNSRTGWEWDDWQEDRFQKWDDARTPLPSVQYLRTDDAMENWQGPVLLTIK